LQVTQSACNRAALLPVLPLNSAANHGNGRGGTGGQMITKVVALALLIGILVAGSAIFATNNSRALSACVSNCE
jgi:hypothetical protein